MRLFIAIFWRENQDIKFTIFKFNLLITFDQTVTDNFWGHICNQHILLVTTQFWEKIEGHFWSSSTHSTTHPPWQQVFSYWKTYFKRLNYRLRLLDELSVLFLKLHFLDLFEPELQFFILHFLLVTYVFLEIVQFQVCEKYMNCS